MGYLFISNDPLDMAGSLTANVMMKLVALVYVAFDLVEELGFETEADTMRQKMAGRAYQTQTIIAGIVIGAALLVGFFVIASLNNALPNISNDTLSADKNSTLDRISQGMLLGGVVIIVLFAAVILRVLRSL